MGLRQRLNRLERKAESRRTAAAEAARSEEDKKRSQFYAENPEARRAKIAEIGQAGRRPEPDRASMHPQTRRLIDLCENFLTACERNKERGR